LVCQTSPSFCISLLRIFSCSALAFTILSEALALSIPKIFSSLFLSSTSVTSLSLLSLSASFLYSYSRIAKSSELCFYLICSIILRASFLLVFLFWETPFLLLLILKPYSWLKFFTLLDAASSCLGLAFIGEVRPWENEEVPASTPSLLSSLS